MISLKEVKTRIQSVSSTRQITSAMKMVSSAKLHKAQKTIGDFYLYQTKLNQILHNFLEFELREEGNHSFIPFSDERKLKKVTIVAVSSNNSLCGAFNSHVIKALETTIDEYAYLGEENIQVIPIGKKVRDYARRFPNVWGAEQLVTEPLDSNQGKLRRSAQDELRRSNEKSLDEFVNKPTYAAIASFADVLSNRFLKGETDRVEIIYQHFKSAATQLLKRETYLPFQIEKNHDPLVEDLQDLDYQINYIIEPSPQELIDELIPKVIRLKLFTVILDSLAAEHAARTVAMQIATENADVLLQSLKVQYNKSRQQVITNELLDIIGGTVQ